MPARAAHLARVIFLTTAIVWHMRRRPRPVQTTRLRCWRSPKTPCSIRRRPTARSSSRPRTSPSTAAGPGSIGATQGDPKDFKGVGISAKGVSGVTLKNINVKGWDIGLKIEHGSKWLVENCNFSDNFHYPGRRLGRTRPPRRHRARAASIIPRSARTRPTASGTPAGWSTPTTTWSRKTTSPTPRTPA